MPMQDFTPVILERAEKIIKYFIVRILSSEKIMAVLVNSSADAQQMTDKIQHKPKFWVNYCAIT